MYTWKGIAMKTALGSTWLALLASLSGLAPALAGAAPLDLHSDAPARTAAPPPAGAPNWPAGASPAALAATGDGSLLFIACATANQVAAFDTASARLTHCIDVPASPSGLALSKDGARLYVTCAAPASTICVIDPAHRRIVDRIAAGHTSMAPVLSPDEKTLYVCNRFNDDLSVIDLARRREFKRIRVEREPVAAAITPDGRYLVVANHLHAGPANHWRVQAVVSIVDTLTGDLAKNIPLLEGAGLLRGVALSPDGRFAAVTHLRSMYWRSTTAVELGAMNGNALSVLDMKRLVWLGVVLLDQTARGAANPWAVTWTPDGKTLIVSHAGTHEVSLLDAPLEADPASFLSLRIGDYAPDGAAVPPPPSHPVRLRKRLSLPGLGPRALALAGTHLYVANYFSDSLCRINLAAAQPTAELLPLAPARTPSLLRNGEMWFNDARLCAQGWQSCASCHDADGRADALNWDLLNDGLGNPKNTRSLIWAHQTGPAMALGVRPNAEAAVRAGIRHILFTEQPQEVPAAIDAWLKSLRPLPSPHLLNGHLSAAAQRGQQLFMSAKTGCAACHPPPLFSDRACHDVGTAATYPAIWGVPGAGADQPSAQFYTPALVELWRSAPYLHDGSAATLREVLSENRNDRHGRTSRLTKPEIEDLVEYLLSL